MSRSWNFWWVGGLEQGPTVPQHAARRLARRAQARRVKWTDRGQRDSVNVNVDAFPELKVLGRWRGTQQAKSQSTTDMLATDAQPHIYQFCCSFRQE